MSGVRSLRRGLVLVATLLGAAAELLWKRPATRVERAQWLHRLCRCALVRLEIPVRAEGVFPEHGTLICNHLGYLDIVALAGLHPCVFVSKAEIARWPFIGWLATMAGTVFVERGRGGSAAEVGGQLREATRGEVPVAFFPEGTTSNGKDVLPFHSGLLGETLLSGGAVTPAVIAYHLAESNGPDATVDDDVAFWGDRGMVPHLLKFLGLRRIEVDVRLGTEPIAFTDAALRDRRVAAIEAREAVLALRDELRDGAARQPGEARP